MKFEFIKKIEIFYILVHSNKINTYITKLLSNLNYLISDHVY